MNFISLLQKCSINLKNDAIEWYIVYISETRSKLLNDEKILMAKFKTVYCVYAEFHTYIIGWKSAETVELVWGRHIKYPLNIYKYVESSFVEIFIFSSCSKISHSHRKKLSNFWIVVILNKK